MHKLTESDLDNAILWRRSGFREIDTHSEFDAYVELSQMPANEARMLQPMAPKPIREPRGPSAGWWAGLAAGAAVVAYLVIAGVWQWN